MAEEYVVKVALAQLRVKDGSYVHVYQGGPVPELFEGDRELLHEQGFIGPKDQEYVVDESKKGKWVKTEESKPAPKSAAPKP